MSALERHPQGLAPTPHKVLGTGIDGRGIPKGPLLSIPGKPIFPALRRLSSRGSTHTTVARGTALWESLVGKPPGKASWESLEGNPQIP